MGKGERTVRKVSLSERKEGKKERKGKGKERKERKALALLKGSMGPLLTREAAACATFHKSHKWHTARRFVPVLWFGTFHSTGSMGEPTGKERKKGARVKTTVPSVLSTIARKVTRRTMAGPDASYSLKPAESLSRCPHTRQGVKRLPGASGSLSALISAAYGSGCHQDASKGKELYAPKRGKTARTCGKLRART
jgi:hypothetical protein